MMKQLPASALLCVTLAASVAGDAAAQTTHDVTVQNFSFSPNDLTIRVGDIVRWTNVQGTHDVVEDNDAWESGAPGQGWVFSRTFNDPGEILYHCSVHSSPGQNIDTNMNGRLDVVMPPEFVFGDGFEDLPPP